MNILTHLWRCIIELAFPSFAPTHFCSQGLEIIAILKIDQANVVIRFCDFHDAAGIKRFMDLAIGNEQNGFFSVWEFQYNG